jgi:23S rRNA (uridine2552-2'-O)-methyltransferase
MKRDYSEKERFHSLAHEKGVPSRAFFKIEEIVDRVIKRRFEKVIDLGCFPGGWSSFLLKRADFVVGVDLKETSINDKRFRFIMGDVREEETIEKIERVVNSVDAVFSDMSPKISGISATDQERGFELFLAFLKVARKFLKKGGVGVVKVFYGERFESILKEMRKCFKTVKVFKPSASMRSAKEVYLVGINFKKEVENGLHPCN